ncbi:dipeptidyl-peptidase IV Serine peptidase. MEROPS family S15 [Ligilactobacillus sp. WC1T17]|uniref:Xaa-Pro dipeptidyl-peptidase n=1 Tax=Ligilactobacillus ruminis TaxID=1623 RepID=A0ABY1ACV8_9LACO|nr:dipeptidyl-peptidase IV Serine peptidase. MEROPS family S15 [Ligilactobacillus ruminis]
MKFNQFSIVKTPFAIQQKELASLGFIDDASWQKTNLNQLFADLLKKCFPQAKTAAAKDEKFHQLAATSALTIVEFLQTEPLTLDVFYAVGMQLLGFEVGCDFSLNHPLEAMDKYNLTHKKKLNDQKDLLKAFYLLLNTRTKNGQIFLDRLANLGFFTPFYDLPAEKKPLFFNGKAQPVIDTNQLIYEVVYVESDLDSDGDGKADLLKTEIIRPKDTENGLKVPVVYTASPYNQGTNDSDVEALTHDVNIKLTRKEPNHLTYDDIKAPVFKKPEVKKITPVDSAKEASETFGREFSYTLNDYFLARGFAAVYAAGIGTLDSDGFRTCGSKEETLSATAIIEWLHGDRKAFTDRTSGVEIKAWWSNGKVAMTGKSYLGTLAQACATTGVKGLETIIAEAAISSWYDYYRDGGLVIAPGGFPGEDADVLAEDCFSRRQNAGSFLKIKQAWNSHLNQITQGQDRTSGSYNTFWDARNYLNDVQNVKCDAILVHGLNDWNVKLRNVYQFYQALKSLPTTTKLILHQGQHIYINNFQSLDFSEMMNLWLSYKLYGLDNGAKNILPDVLVQDNTQESTWVTQADWVEKDAKNYTLGLRPCGKLKEGQCKKDDQKLTFGDVLPKHLFEAYTKDTAKWQADLLSSDTVLASNRLIWQSKALAQALTLEGTPHLDLDVAVDNDHGMLSFMVVDYGLDKRLAPVPATLARKALDCGFHWRNDDLMEFKLASQTPFKMITKGHLNLQNRTNLYQADDLKPNEFVHLSLDLQPMRYVLKAGHKLGLVIYATDMGMTVRGNEDLKYTIDCKHSSLSFYAK